MPVDLILPLERVTQMATMVKGAKRYVLVRGKDETGNDIVIDIFNKAELNGAMKEGRIEEKDHVVKIDVLERVNLKKPQKSQKG